MCSNPDRETSLHVMAPRRRAEVTVSTSAAEHNRDPKSLKSTFISRYRVGGVSPSALMIMRWVLTLPDDGK